jgi:hypothetical protein
MFSELLLGEFCGTRLARFARRRRRYLESLCHITVIENVGHFFQGTASAPREVGPPGFVELNEIELERESLPRRTALLRSGPH